MPHDSRIKSIRAGKSGSGSLKELLAFHNQKAGRGEGGRGQGGVQVSVPAPPFIERTQDSVLGWCQPHWMGPQRPMHSRMPRHPSPR